MTLQTTLTDLMRTRFTAGLHHGDLSESSTCTASSCPPVSCCQLEFLDEPPRLQDWVVLPGQPHADAVHVDAVCRQPVVASERALVLPCSHLMSAIKPLLQLSQGCARPTLGPLTTEAICSCCN